MEESLGGVVLRQVEMSANRRTQCDCSTTKGRGGQQYCELNTDSAGGL